MAKKLTKAHLAITLMTIVEAGEEGMYAPAELANSLLEKGLVEINAGDVDEYGCVATRATQAGIDHAFEEQRSAGPEEAPVAAAQTGFAIVDSVEVPKSHVRRTKQGSKYPFDQLEIGQSFFVPQTAKSENIVRTMSSQVSNAKKLYSEAIPGEFKTNKNGQQIPKLHYHRNFIARPVEDGAPWGFPGVKGAGVWRVELEA